MSARSLLDRLYDAMASLRLAVAVMLTLGTTCLVATIYESKHGTAAVQRDVYRTEWFAAILALLGLNIFCSMMKRFPWKSHHTGFVMAHVGILLLLFGSVVSLHFGLDGNMALYEGETGDRVALLDRALQVAGPEMEPAVVPVELERRPPGPGRERRLSLGSGMTLVATDFRRHVAVKEGFEEDPAGSPALHFTLKSSFFDQDGWLAAADPQRSHLDLGPASLGFHAVGSPEDPLTHGEGQNQIAFGLAPSGPLRYAIVTRTGEVRQGTVEIGKTIETPWMGMTVTVDRLLPKASLKRTMAPAPPPEKDERRQPAVLVHLEGPKGRSNAAWLPWTEARTLQIGDAAYQVAYRSPEVATPFRVTLLDFNSDKYPGSNMAATYESWVRVDDPEKGVSEHHISMNQPLHYRGYIFFQASFVEGEPMMSIFSVARSPGLPLVYAGTTLLSLGVIWMFYVKPYLAKRKAALALARHERERSHEEDASSRPAAAPAGAPDPAPRGA
jgi:hypothetical protein